MVTRAPDYLKRFTPLTLEKASKGTEVRVQTTGFNRDLFQIKNFPEAERKGEKSGQTIDIETRGTDTV